MQQIIEVDNIKCGGCAKTIQNSLLKMPNIQKVTVEIETGQITVEGDNLNQEEISEKLLALGYPKKGTVSGFNSLKAKGKSFVSCAIGRMDKS
jgi:copper chaperone